MWNKLTPPQRTIALTGCAVLVLILAAAVMAVVTLSGAGGLISSVPGEYVNDAMIQYASQASSTRWLVLILLLLCSAIVVGSYFQFGKQLQKQEEELGRHKMSAGSILASVNDGLFLLDRDYAIGDQYSEALTQIFGRSHFAGENFFELMSGLVTDKTINTTRDYLDLLFGERVNERLVQDLNPLDVVEFNFDEGNGQFRSKFLGFRFKRVFADGQLSYLLVTVSDITKSVAIEQELRESREKTQAQMDMLVELLHVDPFQLNAFLSRAQASLEECNRILREPSTLTSEYKAKVSKIFKMVHGVKGESGQIGLASFQSSTHDIENILTTLRNKATLNGNDFLTFTVKLEELFTQLDSVRVLLHRVGQLRVADTIGQKEREQQAQGRPVTESAASPVASAAVDLGNSIRQLAAQLAARYGKQVQVTLQGMDAANVPAGYVLLLRDVMAQFTRNAVVHGIESPAERRAARKNETGTLSISFTKTPEGGELVFRDDGAGMPAEKLRAALVRGGKYTEAQAATLDQKQLLTLIFDPAFTTADFVDENAGRGVGLGMVREWVQSARGQLRLATAAGKGTQMKVVLPSL